MSRWTMLVQPYHHAIQLCVDNFLHSSLYAVSDLSSICTLNVMTDLPQNMGLNKAYLVGERSGEDANRDSSHRRDADVMVEMLVYVL